MPPRHSVLITGARRGFGLALVRAYLNRGARVFALVRDPAHADAIARLDPARCVPLVGDVRDDAVLDEIDRVLDRHGGELDMLVNNAGVAGRGMRLELLSAEDLRGQFDLHCAGAMRCARAALPFLESTGGGIVVNLSSRLGSLSKNAAGEFADGDFSFDYRIAKAAQNMLTLCLSQELSARGVTVCALHPGRLKTDSGSADAELSAGLAAERFIDFFERASEDINGRFIDLFGGELPW